MSEFDDLKKNIRDALQVILKPEVTKEIEQQQSLDEDIEHLSDWKMAAGAVNDYMKMGSPRESALRLAAKNYGVDTKKLDRAHARLHGEKKLRAVGEEVELTEDDDHHRTMTHAVTEYDRKQEAAAAKNPRRYHNRYALPQYLSAVDRAHADIKKGHSVGDAVNNHFNGGLARHLHKKLKTGDTDVDSKRRKAWGESVEVNELSDKTLKSYVKKAAT